MWPWQRLLRVPAALLLAVVLTACAGATGRAAAPEDPLSGGDTAAPEPAGRVAGASVRPPPVVRFLTRYDADDVVRCIDERWSRLSALGPGDIRRHASFRGAMVDVRVGGEPLARAQAEVYRVPGATVVDYFIRPAVDDPLEDLRLRALRYCLG
ncbi:hypothetical protein [Chitinasiproducens palmae]|uniref:Lipoprotein n=1 Tax=Chitinasiproducens palmae TaxID=1770053 RepID=A0A1H2PWI4_9BURK|nr:hypothetical protein [Chitinasiproducens palmae]SDV50913.1 hypothetical protein SAMN05216551_11422 [Chitinasiproducens palmae]